MLCCLPGPGSVQIADDSRTGYQDPGNPFGEPDPPLADQGKRCEEHSGSDTPTTSRIPLIYANAAFRRRSRHRGKYKEAPCDKKPAGQCKAKAPVCITEVSSTNRVINALPNRCIRTTIHSEKAAVIQTQKRVPSRTRLTLPAPRF